MNIEIEVVNYLDKRHAKDISYLLNSYAKDEMGGSEALSEYVQENLASELSKIPHAFSIISYVDDKPAGLINCFEGFSTFKCKALINIHDIIVNAEFRGLGLSQKMLSRVEEIAKQRECCKITLEVLEGNKIAQNAYKKFGFASYELDPKMGRALFWQKNI
jgi:ribosomal protein S18 acetylase RimI-like enzyme